MFDIDRFVDENVLSVSVKNKGLNYGLGCIDGIRAFWNERKKQLYIFRLEDHLKRFHNSGKSLFIPIPYTVSQLSSITKQLLEINKVSQDVYIRPICFKGADTLRPDLNDPPNHLAIYTVFSEYQPKPYLKVCISSWTRIGSNMIPPQAKPTAGYLNSGLAINEAVRNGCDEALFLTMEGNVCEGATENLFIVRDNKLITPPESDDILPGITRDTVFMIGINELKLPVIKQTITRVELYEADEVFLTGTAVGIKPVIEVDRRVIGTGQVGPVTTKIQQLYNQIVRGELASYKNYCTPCYSIL
ncbi:branched-chain amino acid transaminase [Halobacillus salinarum]|uniref:Branched-chain-amino-acid aminotransferase n=1 Tax=Halobacillus salinarum TaxID=2932257 RepID=A0ABY4EPP3_9BACI|nr:branched-chain amino acid transaminase [Halobacillus salinarum]UOQ46417.1 branched-chain amino acid transaminase [Halobacillus salinarum]